MTEQQIGALGPDFDNYLQQFDLCCNHPATFRLLGVYCRGLLSPLPRKSAEPIALAAGVAVRTLQEFLRDHRWSYQLAREALHQAVIADLATFPDEGLGNIGVVDETSVAKKGTKTPGVQRQWCGAVGKVENCIVTVHLGVARGRYKTLIDAELFLPESWADDPERCAEADIPEGREHQPKWQLALRQILRARVTGFTFDWMTFDEGYGSKPGFLDRLDDWDQGYVGEVPRNFSCFSRPPRAGQTGSWVEDLARHSPSFYRQSWQEVRLPRQTLGEQVWLARMAEVWVRDSDGVRVRHRWLIVAENEATGETKYFISAGGPAETDLAVRLRVGFQRYHVEHCFRLSKEELGWCHYEGRSYVGLMRHLMLCLVTGGFAAREAASLRGEKSGGNGGASLSRAERGVPGLADDAARYVGGGRGVGHDPIPPTSQFGGSPIPATPQCRPAAGATTLATAAATGKCCEITVAL